ncbi:hypothetical protein GUITHDRAFT_152611 [Guillardia theta CCMP2712]|uniref:Uncharacterized protein n=1 Tax=Guillardia theta (strain CCMP2712) TaxID=905079 RepID=L1JBP7_GUITC|nr:hypothetical protein GUITHDRAFT_152611 [Guillardia theta CCMP2712]EKX45936.1 hypothetical protein GUITHDRAFT_152611 [Guillardia theta CCMP2712]|eukprot:XP_005832916.1 hypothetical protein GUITHDRAFT_152611 [Guillardia theta CCMP2712]
MSEAFHPSVKRDGRGLRVWKTPEFQSHKPNLHGSALQVRSHTAKKGSEICKIEIEPRQRSDCGDGRQRYMQPAFGARARDAMDWRNMKVAEPAPRNLEAPPWLKCSYDHPFYVRNVGKPVLQKRCLMVGA